MKFYSEALNLIQKRIEDVEEDLTRIEAKIAEMDGNSFQRFWYEEKRRAMDAWTLNTNLLKSITQDEHEAV